MQKKVLVFGFARSGISLARLLRKQNKEVIIYDQKEKKSLNAEEIKTLEEMGIMFVLNKEPDFLLPTIEQIIVSPGISKHHEFLQKAKKNHIPIVSEFQYAYDHCLSKEIVMVSGTNGKSTTVTLLYEIVKAHHQKAFLAGNIGTPFSEIVEKADSNSTVILEVSSFQLEISNCLKPKYSVLLNVTPDHLDRHQTFETYRREKEKIFRHQTAEDFFIYNADDENICAMAGNSAAKTYAFSTRKQGNGLYFEQGSIYLTIDGCKEKLLSVNDLHLFGMHNIENIMAAALTAYVMGVDLQTIRTVCKDFKGIAHRLEFVCAIDSHSIFNDSKATNAESAIKALQAFTTPVVLIAGGMIKQDDFFEWVSLFPEKVSHVCLMGESKYLIERSMKKIGYLQYTLCENMEEAIHCAFLHAKQNEVILLSPACASWDMFDNFEQRGEIFKELIGRRKMLD